MNCSYPGSRMEQWDLHLPQPIPAGAPELRGLLRVLRLSELKGCPRIWEEQNCFLWQQLIPWVEPQVWTVSSLRTGDWVPAAGSSDLTRPSTHMYDLLHLHQLYVPCKEATLYRPRNQRCTDFWPSTFKIQGWAQTMSSVIVLSFNSRSYPAWIKGLHLVLE